ncbi:hypothetical protein KSP39_PZI016979 [Platanthera zijinensis]|uniref:Uncharacterized protein n=1 Tax=Platanthera zijinensis TaxID=2320716 RepID=A0AAP0G144_9ASPA
MAAINSLLCSCSAHNLLPRPPRNSSLVGRRALLRSPFMSSVDNSSPSSSILGLDAAPLIVSSDTQSSESPPTAGDHGQSRSSPSEKDTGSLNLSFSSLANAPTWAKLVLGAVAILAIPFLGKLLRTEGVLQNVEEVEKVVETVAEAVEKITAEIAEVLPDGESKEEVLKLEKIAFFVDKNAEALDYIIDKIDEAVEETETQQKKNEGDNEATKKNDAGNNIRKA